jgi:S1-C subfamily serine protease
MWLAAIMLAAACSGPVGSAASPTPTGGVAGATATSSESAPGGAEQGIPTVVKNVSPSIVLIEASGGLGSGVVFDSLGDIVTNAHVTGTSTQFKVTASDGKQYDATLVGSFTPSDVAVIKTSGASLKAAKWGDSTKLVVGQTVLAMGNPLGLQSSVTNGIVSALGRTVPEPDGAVLTNLIQTSAAINPGNSGGGLVNLGSEVVGVPTLGAVDPNIGSAAPGIGFALPSNTVVDYANQIVKNGKVINTHRAYLGVQVGNLSTGNGVVVLALVPGGPADAAGVKEGDIITAINGHAVPDATTLSVQLGTLAPGSTAMLTVIRGGQTMTIHVTLGTLPG